MTATERTDFASVDRYQRRRAQLLDDLRRAVGVDAENAALAALSRLSILHIQAMARAKLTRTA